MNAELKKRAIEVITEHILTPVLYFLEDDYQNEFVCFCDTNMDFDVVAETEMILCELLQKNTVVIDIREYCEADRMEIINEAELIYSANPMLERIFELSMAEDFKRAAMQKAELVRRYDNSGSVYLQ